MQRLFDKRDTDSWVEASGIVTRLFSDDTNGERHQRFVLNLRNGQTVMVAHNTDIAGRVPVGLGDRIRLRGLYEWNEQGGMIHWTHRDPMGVEEGGFIKFRRQDYR